MNFLEEIKDPKEREITAQFWADRYRRAPAVMATDMNLDIQGGRLVPPEAGDPGLKMPWLEGENAQRSSVGVEGSDWKQDFETHLKRLDHQAKQRTGIDALDQQRLQLMYEVERSGFEVWELRDATAQHDPAYKQEAQHRFHRALGDLVELDAKMGHPNADQHRDLVERPATAQEQLAWLYRDGRQPNQDEVTYQNNHGDLSDLRQRVNSADLWQSQPIQPGRFRLDEGVAQSPAQVGERLGEKEMLQQAHQARWVQRDGQGLAQEQGPIKAQLSQESVLERLAKRREQQLGRSLQR